MFASVQKQATEKRALRKKRKALEVGLLFEEMACSLGLTIFNQGCVHACVSDLPREERGVGCI